MYFFVSLSYLNSFPDTLPIFDVRNAWCGKKSCREQFNHIKNIQYKISITWFAKFVASSEV